MTKIIADLGHYNVTPNHHNDHSKQNLYHSHKQPHYNEDYENPSQPCFFPDCQGEYSAYPITNQSIKNLSDFLAVSGA